MFIKLDYVPSLAPVDIIECWTADGTAAEIVEEKRGEVSRSKLRLKKVKQEEEPEDEFEEDEDDDDDV